MLHNMSETHADWAGGTGPRASDSPTGSKSALDTALVSLVGYYQDAFPEGGRTGTVWLGHGPKSVRRALRQLRKRSLRSLGSSLPLCWPGRAAWIRFAPSEPPANQTQIQHLKDKRGCRLAFASSHLPLGVYIA